jgi:tight adherence protein B
MMATINLLGWILGLATFMLVLCLWIGVLLVQSIQRRSRRQKVQERIGMVSQSGPVRELRLWHDGKEVTTVVPGGPRRPPAMKRARLFLEEAGWNRNPLAVVGGVVGAAALAGLIVYGMTDRVVLGIALAVLVMVGVWVYLLRRVASQRVLFERQIIDGLELAGRSLRAGHPLIGSFHVIADEIAAPVGTMFKRICQEQAIGVSLEESLREMSQLSSSPDMKFFATAVVLQIRSGGNLADMMEHLAKVIRTRQWLNRRVRVLTAQTQLSKWILVALPAVVFVALNVVNPEYMKPMYTQWVGQCLLWGCAGMIVVGMIVMNRLAKLRY